MLAQLAPHERHALDELIHAVNAVLDAHPAVEADTLQFAEDRVVVVQPPADRAVLQALRVTLRAALLPPQILERARRERTVAGVHGHDPMFHAAE